MKKTISSPVKPPQAVKNNRSSFHTEIIPNKTLENNIMSEPVGAYKVQEKKIIKSKAQSALSQQIIYGQILEIDKDSVILRCLVDEDERLFQKRRFDRQFFEGAVNLVINQLVEVKVYIRQGEVKFTFANSNRQDLTEKFKPKDYFSKYAGSVLFQPLPLHIDEDNF